MANNNQTDTMAELWNLFFYDSTHAKLVVNAKTQKIMHVNDVFVEIFSKNTDLKGESWLSFDDADNHHHYPKYIKIINSDEIVKFIIRHKNTKKIQNYQAEYQMGVLDGEIVYIGTIKPEDIQGVAYSIYQAIKKTNQINIQDLSFITNLEEIRELLKLEFLTFVEFQNNEFSNPISAGNEKSANKFIVDNMEMLTSILHDKIELEIDLDKDKLHKHCKLLKTINAQSLCIYPIHNQNKIYGAIIASGNSEIDNWHTISLLLRNVANKCKFGLYQKSIVDQHEIEGLIDKLTGLPNRNSMIHKLSDLTKDGISADRYLSLMIIEIHDLNYYNKKFGMELTDEIIINISRTIVKSINSKGDIYRLSGDEFMVLLHPHLEKELVVDAVEKLIEKLNRNILISNGNDISIDFNIGVSIFPDDGQTVSSMIKNADIALYDAKLVGKNNYIVFKFSETGQALKQKTEMEENLKIAIESGHIIPYFQPKINAITEDIVGFEALVRWIDPEIGMITPGHFIPLAEDTGLISSIGELITAQSCELLSEWQEKYGLALSCSINLSVVQLMDSRLPDKLEEIINTSGVHPHYIDFEITETIGLDTVPNLVDILKQIVDIGCSLSIDDFGTGHSSLDYVKKIPATYIKIDQSFVANIGLNPEDEAILDATINIAKRLKRKIIAEGVETESQREYLLDKDCDFFQGYLFARPLPQKDIEKLLQQRIQLMGVN